jgi:hypothetical protein
VTAMWRLSSPAVIEVVHRFTSVVNTLAVGFTLDFQFDGLPDRTHYSSTLYIKLFLS